ncbi:hypothetical protein GWK47_006258 [Chionoecetes opilio]|uniref:Uncharacterized protein n=1 Tax=Chionoecetes opilio TaxID=41210 RepID=A0A8J4Y6M8_CHIOP|nr:hypothetical protein GWK47_006258 [Chionoecetes opilio]
MEELVSPALPGCLPSCSARDDLALVLYGRVTEALQTRRRALDLIHRQVRGAGPQDLGAKSRAMHYQGRNPSYQARSSRASAGLDTDSTVPRGYRLDRRLSFTAHVDYLRERIARPGPNVMRAMDRGLNGRRTFSSSACTMCRRCAPWLDLFAPLSSSRSPPTAVTRLDGAPEQCHEDHEGAPRWFQRLRNAERDQIWCPRHQVQLHTWPLSRARVFTPRDGEVVAQRRLRLVMTQGIR